MTYAYYPGCSLKGTAIDYHTSALALAERLGIELKEMEDWVCCGASPIHQRNPALASGVANLLLSLSEGISNDVAVLCAACYHNMKKAEVEMREDGKKRNEVEELSGIPFNPEVRTRHFLEILDKDYGLNALKEKVVKPLNELRVACYYGCLLSRPAEIAFDDPEQPMIMERVLEAAGAETVSWSHRLECCGASQRRAVDRCGPPVGERCSRVGPGCRGGHHCLCLPSVPGEPGHATGGHRREVRGRTQPSRSVLHPVAGPCLRRDREGSDDQEGHGGCLTAAAGQEPAVGAVETRGKGGC